jgi:hypothetical protein
MTWTDELEVFCADIGSIENDNFWWARRLPGDDEEEHQPGEIAALARAISLTLRAGRPVALGLEMPLFAPVPEEFAKLGKARPCDLGAPAWSSAIGASVMATGMVQLAWVLRNVRRDNPDAQLFLRWDEFAESRSGLLIWEAFVTRDAKGDDHEEDAKNGLEAFCAQLPDAGDANAEETEAPFSLAAAVAIWADWDVKADNLARPTVLVRALAPEDS